MKQSEKNLMVINNFILHYTHDNVEMGCDEMYQAAFEYIEEDWVDGKPADKEQWKDFEHDYFKVVKKGYDVDLQREEIQIHAGENGNIMYRITKNAKEDTIQANIRMLETDIYNQFFRIKSLEKEINKYKRWVAKDIAKLAEHQLLLKTKF